MIIIGAGMAGLLCGALNPTSTILEASDQQPDEHKAVLRLRTNEISRLTGIPMQKVTVHKAVWSEGKEQPLTIALAHQYSSKVSDKISARSIFNLAAAERYIPPVDFVGQLRSRTSKINYGIKVASISRSEIYTLGGKTLTRVGEPVVSTLPMPILAKLTLESDPAAFKSEKIYVSRFKITNCDSYCTIYYPDMSTGVYRATINGSILIIEAIDKITSDDEFEVFKSFGISPSMTAAQESNHCQKTGKITNILPRARKNFILNQTLANNIYSLGRFATWRPKVMLDDVVDDIFHIRRLISEGNYAAQNHSQGEK